MRGGMKMAKMAWVMAGLLWGCSGFAAPAATINVGALPTTNVVYLTNYVLLVTTSASNAPVRIVNLSTLLADRLLNTNGQGFQVNLTRGYSTNRTNWYSMAGGPSTNREPFWTGEFIGGDFNQSMHWLTPYGAEVAIQTFRGDPSAVVSNIVYYLDQNGKVYSADWKLMGTDKNQDPRYVFNFLDEFAAQQSGIYMRQRTNNEVFMEAYTPDTFGGMWVWSVTNNLLRLGNSIYPVYVRGGATVTVESNLIAAAALATSPGATVTLTADNQTVATTNRSYIRLTSNDVVAANRTFVLTPANVTGQVLTLEWTSNTAQGELVDDSANTGGGNNRLSATWSHTGNGANDVLTLKFNGTDWVEVSRSSN